MVMRRGWSSGCQVVDMQMGRYCLLGTNTARTLVAREMEEGRVRRQ